MEERETNNERYSLEISVFEVYNNEINDLLATGDVSTIIKRADLIAACVSIQYTLSFFKIFQIKEISSLFKLIECCEQ